MSYEDKIKNVLTDSETYVGENEDKAAELGAKADDEIRRLKRNEETLRSATPPEHYVEADVDYMMMLAEGERRTCRSGWFVAQAVRIKAAISRIAELEEQLKKAD